MNAIRRSTRYLCTRNWLRNHEDRIVVGIINACAGVLIGMCLLGMWMVTP